MSLAFTLVFVAAAPFWTMMIVAPRWRWTSRVMSSPWSVTPPLVFWFVFAVPRFGELLPAVLKPTLEGWQELVADPAALTFTWSQIIAWDLFVGRWIYLDSRERGIHPLVVSPLLVLAVLFSPIAVPLYLLVRRLPGARFVVFDPEPEPRSTVPDSLTTAGPVRRALLGWHRPLMLFVAFAAVTTVVSMVGLAVDDRVLVGAAIWAKPAKFAFSFGLYALTLAWLLSLPRRHVKLGRKIGTITAVACFLEVAVVAVQTVRGHRSHFNIETAFDATMWAVMAASILVLWIATLVGAVVIMRERYADLPSLWALRLGTLISLAGMAVAFMMVISTSAQRAERPRTTVGAHSVGVVDGGPGMPVTGWNLAGGDLRAAHFIGIHGLQAVPLFLVLLGLLAPRLPRLRDERVRVRLVWTFAGGYAGLLVLTTWQALRRQAFLSPDALTLGALGALVIGTAVAAVWAFTPPPNYPGVDERRLTTDRVPADF
jgi:hypothetical protein